MIEKLPKVALWALWVLLAFSVSPGFSVAATAGFDTGTPLGCLYGGIQVSGEGNFAVTCNTTGGLEAKFYDEATQAPLTANSCLPPYTYTRADVDSTGSVKIYLSGCATVNTAPPGIPTISSATPGPGDWAVTVNFGLLSAATLYRATCTLPDDPQDPGKMMDGIGSSIKINDLTNGIRYACKVAAYNSAGWGSDSSPVYVTPGPPGAPTNVTVEKGVMGAKVSFMPPSNKEGIDLYQATCTKNGDPTDWGMMTGSGSATQIDVTGLTSGATYTCTVAAHNLAGWGSESAPSSNVTLDALTKPGIPAGVTATPGDKTAIVGFTPLSEAGIDLYRATCRRANELEKKMTGAASPINVSGLTNGQAYACTVAAHNLAGWGYESNSINVTPALPAYTLTVKSAGASKVQIIANPSTYGGSTDYPASNIAGGTLVALTAPSDVGSASFKSWSGCDSISGTVCTVTMSSEKIVTASYLLGQTITFNAAPTVIYKGTGIVTATGGGSNNPVIFSSLTGTVCSVSGSTVTGLAAGMCTITANQTGNGSYSAAPQATLIFPIAKTTQTIAFGAKPSVAVGKTGTVSATSSSGLAVILSSATTGVCTIAGETVSGKVAGQCRIVANQPGDNNYDAAPQSTQWFCVGGGICKSNIMPIIRLLLD